MTYVIFNFILFFLNLFTFYFLYLFGLLFVSPLFVIYIIGIWLCYLAEEYLASKNPRFLFLERRGQGL
jgi:hypothetical protein